MGRYLLRIAIAAVVVGGFPWLPFLPESVLGRTVIGGQYALVAISLVVLTGWVGQVSLGHAALVGMGAYVSGLVLGVWHVSFPVNMLWGIVAGAGTAGLLGLVALRVRGLYLAVATLIFSWTADVFLFQQQWLTKHSSVEVPTIGRQGTFPYFDFGSRRTFYYAVWATVLITIYMMSNLRDRKSGRAFFAIRGSEMAAASLGIDVVRTKLVAFAVSGAIAGAAGTLTLMGARVVTTDQFTVGQSFFYLSVAVVGGLTSLYGAIAAGFVFSGIEELFFRVPAVGPYLPIIFAGLLAVVLLVYPGGLAALTVMLRARLAARLKRHGYPERAYVVGRRIASSAFVGRIVKAVVSFAERLGRLADRTLSPRTARQDAPEIEVLPLPDATADVRPAGLVDRVLRQPAITRRLESFRARRAIDTPPPLELGHQALDATVEMEPVKIEPEPPVAEPVTPDVVETVASPRWETEEFPDASPTGPRELRAPLIEAEEVVVQFGGLTAVNKVSLQVRQGEIVGLIGPNGAGKTTTFNAIAGFVTPTDGRVRIRGTDVTSLPVHLRARLGVARTFQVIQLFPQLSVFDNLLVATNVHDASGLFGSMLVSRRSLEEERKARARVAEVIGLLGLQDVSDRLVTGLPFGVLRMVEIARALVTGASIVMLDEPASGLDDVETARLSRLIRFIRSLGVTILLIEHDVQMVTGISDYMYVVDQGRLIAEGVPQEIQRNEAVIAAYLGGSDEEEPAEEPKPVAAGRR
jgi:branched-chain amino acid transport system ATP-binding protein